MTRVVRMSGLFLALLGGSLRAQAAPPLPPLDSLQLWARRDSLDARSFFDLGMALWSKHRFEPADSAFRRALWLSPHYAEPRLALALLPLGRGETYLWDMRRRVSEDSMASLFRSSAQLYRDAFLLDPLVDPRILRYLGMDALVPRGGIILGNRAFVFTAPWWEGRTKRGVQALVDGKYGESFAVLDSLLTDRDLLAGRHILPDLFLWYYGIAAAHAAHYDKAAAAFKMLAQRSLHREDADPDGVIPTDRADYLYFYAAMSEQSANPGAAVPAYQEALAIDLGMFEAHARLADIYEAHGDTANAVAERHRAIEVSPDFGKLQLDLGVTLLQLGRAVAAESAFVAAAHLLPNDAGAQQFLATVALQVGDTALARPALARFIIVAPARYSAQVADARRVLAGLP